ncbi:hypothetical protein RhiirA4_433147, partial [Rhizophagus irregularis]
QRHTEEELYEMINDSMLLQFEEEDDEINNETQSKNVTVSNIPNHIVQVLIIEKIIDLKDAVKGLENNDTDDEIDSDDSNASNESSDNSTSDDDSENENDINNIDELTQQHLLDDDLDELEV